jgi:thiol-disulfide isomerase/thioredoxin
MKHVVTLYTKPGCHLCEPVAEAIREVAAKYRFEFVSRNIQDDPADFAKYKNDIPVVTVDGIEIARHRMTADQLERALQ